MALVILLPFDIPVYDEETGEYAIVQCSFGQLRPPAHLCCSSWPSLLSHPFFRYSVMMVGSTWLNMHDMVVDYYYAIAHFLGGSVHPAGINLHVPRLTLSTRCEWRIERLGHHGRHSTIDHQGLRICMIC
jgi:hypothetical protein